MPLVNLKTNLKSLRFGKDRPGGGSSKQPFIQLPYFPYNTTVNGGDALTPIKTEDLGRTGGPDFILRGGLLVPTRSVQDASRLFQLFTQTPRGLQFTAKQNILSRIGTDMDAGYPSVIKLLGGPLNQGIYTPLSTLGQAAVNALGIHLFKQGLNPISGGPKYTTLVAPLGNEEAGIKFVTEQTNPFNNNTTIVSNNRLVNLYKGNITTQRANPLSGDGGSGPNATLFTYGGGPGSILGIGKTEIKTTDVRTPFRGIGQKGAIHWATFSQEQLKDAPRIGDGGSTLVEDFRKKLISENTTSFLSSSPSYTEKNIETRLNQGDPGARTADRSDYSKGRWDNERGMDQINSLYLYRSKAVTTDKRKNDIVKFRIATIDNDDPAFKIFTHFRAFINSFSDDMSANWNSFKYIGRGEEFYNYQGYQNRANMAFTVVAQSIQELSIMYQKLNYLKSTLAPDYSDSGYMRGNIHQLTLGGYFYEVPGVIENLSYTIPNDTTWEIGIPANNQEIEAEGGITFRNPEVKELPHRIEVNMSFRPIYSFLPRTVVDINGGGNIKERFISLEDNLGNNNLYQKTPSNLFRPSDHQIVEKQAKTVISPRTPPTPSGVRRQAPIFDSQGNQIN